MAIHIDRRHFLSASVASGATYALVGGNSRSEVEQPRPAPVPGANHVRQRVSMGHVRWHGDFASACAASEQSRKPVLLFQMMGRLDERLC
jgi:hypothetical protein